MTQSSFYSDTPNYAADIPAQNDGNTNPVTGNTAAPSSFYQGGFAYSTSIGVPGPSDHSGPSQAPVSFYGSAANYAADVPAQNDSNTNLLMGNSAAPSSFYPNGQNYTQADATAAYNFYTLSQAAATAAANSQSAAHTSEVNAATSATGAANSATAASGSATAAASSATAASGSATSAASSATAASGSATAASGSASAAAGSASAASTSATNAATSATAASGSATAAAGSASSAAASLAAMSPSSATPLMDGTATAGVSTNFSRGDHVHPTDTSRQAALGYTPLNKAGDSMTSGLLSLVCINNIGTASEIGTLEVKGNGTTTNAAMSFHIPGVFGANFGLANDGNLYLGGWSHGAVAYKLWTQRDFNYTPVNKAGDTMTGSLTVNSTIVALGDIYCYRAGSPGTGVIFLNSTNTRYLYFDGSNYNLPGAALVVGGGVTAGGANFSGSMAATGMVTRQGVSAGGWGSSAFNTYWTGSALQCWVDATMIGTFNVTSDHRIKKDVKDFAGTALDEVRKWRTVTYTGADWGVFKANNDVRTSFIAHELQAISPDCVSGEKDGDNPQTLELVPIVARLAKAVQELDAQNKALQQDVKQLQAQLNNNGNGPPPK